MIPGSKCIFSIYNEGTNFRRKYRHENVKYYNENVNRLSKNHRLYARYCKADFYLYADPKFYNAFKLHYFYDYPFLDDFDLINFYKFYQLFYLSKTYEKVIYLDLDLVWTGLRGNIFEDYDFYNGFLINSETYPYENLEQVLHVGEGQHKEHWENPLKGYLASMLLNNKSSMKYFNTGLMGCTFSYVDQLNYFDGIELSIEHLYNFYNENKNILTFKDSGEDKIGYDNETIAAVQFIRNRVQTQPFKTETIKPAQYTEEDKSSLFCHVFSKKKFNNLVLDTHAW